MCGACLRYMYVLQVSRGYGYGDYFIGKLSEAEVTCISCFRFDDCEGSLDQRIPWSVSVSLGNVDQTVGTRKIIVFLYCLIRRS